MKIYKKVILAIILTIISCKENKSEASHVPKVDFLANQLKKEVKQTSPKIVDTICNTTYFICQKFKDNEGLKHIVVKEINTQSEIYDNIEETTLFNASKQLEVIIYLNNDQYVRVFDYIECGDNAEVNFIKNSLTISDINKNGIKEVTFLYDLICNSDFYPADMKLIMIEGDKKYKIRGSKMFFVLDNGDDIPQNINYNIDESFKSAPDEFLDFATDIWTKNLFDTRVGEFNEKRKSLLEQAREKILEEKESFH